MRVLALTLFLFLTLGASVSAQQLAVRRMYGEYVFARDNQILRIEEVIHSLPAESETVRLLKRGRRSDTWSRITGIIGVSAVSVVVSDLLFDDTEGDVPWWLGAGGVAFIGVAIPLTRAGKRNISQATELYNSSLEDTGQTGFRPAPQLAVTENGIGVVIRF